MKAKSAPHSLRGILVVMSKRIGRTRFRNIHPHAAHTFTGVLRWKLGLAAEDTQAVTVKSLHGGYTARQPKLESLTGAPSRTRIRLTWIGHSTFLIQHQGLNILTDPIFGDCQPIPVGRLRRSTAPGIRFEDLPAIDHVLISHSHYDHLDAPTIRALGNKVRYWVPEGLSPWFRRRGITRSQELSWWQTAKLSEELAVHCVPAQHGSARTLFDRNRTHWCGWVVESPDRSAYFAGDTGYSPTFREIGERFGGFDVAMIPIGAYTPRWLMHPVHINPAEAVRVHKDVQSKLSIACHWGTFRLADEPIDEPPTLLAHELAREKVDADKFLALRPGDSVEV
jgi:N-acyl-phosphatidylethanolamine-hydrolysing phospholipase D